MVRRPISKTSHTSVLLFLLSVLGIIMPVSYFWGESSLVMPFTTAAVPAAVLLTIVPIVLALIFTYVESGGQGVRMLWRRLLPNRQIGLRWYLLSILLNPTIQFIAYLIAIGLGNSYERYTPLSTLFLIAPAFFFAIFEEVGWTGYATEPLQRRWGALGASFILGAVGIFLHLIAYIQANHSLVWIIGQSIWIVCGRMVMVWVFNHTGKSILPAVLLHVSYNMAYIMYPYQGSSYDPVILSVAACVFVFGIVISSRGTLGLQPSSA